MNRVPAGRSRALKYIRLAAFLAGQPEELERVRMSFDEVEDVIGEALPRAARFPSWWCNDGSRGHSRAWLVAGWRVDGVGHDSSVVFMRAPASRAGRGEP